MEVDLFLFHHDLMSELLCCGRCAKQLLCDLRCDQSIREHSLFHDYLCDSYLLRDDVLLLLRVLRLRVAFFYDNYYY